MKERMLREGVTTGTCAAAAAGMAVYSLCSGTECREILIPLPGRSPVRIAAVALVLRKKSAFCSVIKDAGDDPDVTNGCHVCAEASFPDRTEESGNREMRAFYTDPDYPGLFLTGGEGVGVATKKGLSCPVGSFCINPGPRKMIFARCDEARNKAGRPGESLLLTISVPEGKELACKTFNPRLGIVGGISILGSTGIVKPMSEDAIRETIRLEIRMRLAEGQRIIGMAPGNYGADFFRKHTGITGEPLVTCSNYIGDAVRMAREEGAEGVFLSGHVGKLIKTAGGILNTHSRYGDHRMEIFLDCAIEAGVPEEDASGILSCNTTDEACLYLEEKGYLDAVTPVICRRVKRELERAAHLPAEVILFSSGGYLGETDGFSEMFNGWKNRGKDKR